MAYLLITRELRSTQPNNSSQSVSLTNCSTGEHLRSISGDEEGISMSSFLSILLNPKHINSHHPILSTLSIPTDPQPKINNTTNSSKCSSPPSPLQPSLPSPQPQFSSALPPTSAQPLTLPSAVRSTSTAFSTSPAKLVSPTKSSTFPGKIAYC